MTNRPAALQRVQPVDTRRVAGVEVTAAHLIFTSQDARRCAVYAAIALPSGPGPHPLIIHAPGGGQTVNEADLAFWIGHGFACASFDWQQGLGDHDPARKSAWPSAVTDQGSPWVAWRQFIIPLAVEAVGVVIDWAATIPAIDIRRVGMTGISWGGYLTWVANAYEPRLRAAVPVYGCGGLFARGRGRPSTLAPAMRRRWSADWDPLALGGRQRSPVCWLSGSNDFFGWLRFGEALMASVRQPHRHAHQPNLDHAVLPEDSATAVAWMRHHLCGGPALPRQPRWGSAGVVADRAAQVLAIEEWWTPSSGDDDHRCWWPGPAPAGARARTARVRYADGSVLSAPVQTLRPRRRVADLGDRWSDARAGLGWSWNLGGTQLHGNAVDIQPLPGDASRVRIASGRTTIGFILRQFADPRFNRRGFAGLRLHLTGSAVRLRRLRVVLRTGDGLTRREMAGEVEVGADGLVELSRRTLGFLPRALPWSQVRQAWIEGIPGPQIVVGPITRIRKGARRP